MCEVDEWAEEVVVQLERALQTRRAKLDIRLRILIEMLIIEVRKEARMAPRADRRPESSNR